MPSRGDLYLNDNGLEAQLTVPLMPIEDLCDEDVAVFSFGAIVSVGDEVLAHYEPWPRYDLCSGCHATAVRKELLFDTPEAAAQAGHDWLASLGFSRCNERQPVTGNR